MRWVGKATTHGRQQFYQACVVNGVKYSVGDTVLVEQAQDEERRPWAATIEGLWQDMYGEKWADSRWFYFPEHAKFGKTSNHEENEIFASSHVDEIPVDYILSKCVVMSEEQWRNRMETDKEDDAVPTFLCRKHYSCDTGEFRPLLKDIALQKQVRLRSLQLLIATFFLLFLILWLFLRFLQMFSIVLFSLTLALHTC